MAAGTGDNPPGAATGYRIRYEQADSGTSFGPAALQMDVGDVATAVLRDLKNNKRYIVALSAFNTGGFSAYTEVKDATTLTAPAPSAIATLDLTAGDTRITAKWSEPDGRGVDISGYDVHYRTTGGTYKEWPHAGALRQAELTGLKNNTEYEVRVRGKSVGGAGGWSPAKKATPTAGGTTDPTDPTTPSSDVDPTGVDATMNASTPTSIDVTWKAPTGAVVSGYQVSWVETTVATTPIPLNPTLDMMMEVSAGVVKATIAGLDAETSYRVAVRGLERGTRTAGAWQYAGALVKTGTPVAATLAPPTKLHRQEGHRCW